MVTENLLEAMNISAADFPPDQSELTAADCTRRRQSAFKLQG